MIQSKQCEGAGRLDLAEQRNMFAHKYVSVSNTNSCTRLIACYLTGQMEDVFTKDGIEKISPKSIDDVDSIFKLIKALGAENKVDEIAEINKYLKITLKNFKSLNERDLLGDQLSMRTEHLRVISNISRQIENPKN